MNGRHMLKTCDGKSASMRWPIKCPAVLYKAAFTDKVSPHRIRGFRVKCHRGKWTRRGIVMRLRRAGLPIGTNWRTWAG